LRAASFFDYMEKIRAAGRKGREEKERREYLMAEGYEIRRGGAICRPLLLGYEQCEEDKKKRKKDRKCWRGLKGATANIPRPPSFTRQFCAPPGKKGKNNDAQINKRKRRRPTGTAFFVGNLRAALAKEEKEEAPRRHSQRRKE